MMLFITPHFAIERYFKWGKMTRFIACVIIGLFVAVHGCAEEPGWFSSWRPLRALETSVVFHPQTDKQSWYAAPAGVHIEDVWLQTRDGERIHAWWLPHPQAEGAVLYFHGNAGNISHFGARAYGLRTALKRSVLLIDYPGYGKSSGKPSEAGCYAAADAGHDWLLQTAKYPPQTLVVFGESLGGGVATHIASTKPHQALVLVRTFTSIPDIARSKVITSSAAPLVKNTFDNLGRISKCTQPKFIAHGDRDKLIPLAQATQLYEAAGRPKHFYLMEGHGHSDPWPDEFLPRLANFVNEYSAAPR